MKGAHLLRHSLATGMLRHGASLREIGQVLRHRGVNTTEIYAKVDLTGLRATRSTVARDWRCAMNDLHDALTEYLAMRRSLGFILRLPASLLRNFVAFIERSGSPFITTKLAVQCP